MTIWGESAAVAHKASADAWAVCCLSSGASSVALAKGDNVACPCEVKKHSLIAGFKAQGVQLKVTAEK